MAQPAESGVERARKWLKARNYYGGLQGTALIVEPGHAVNTGRYCTVEQLLDEYARAQRREERREVVEECAKIALKYGTAVAAATIRERFKEELR